MPNFIAFEVAIITKFYSIYLAAYARYLQTLPNFIAFEVYMQYILETILPNFTEIELHMQYICKNYQILFIAFEVYIVQYILEIILLNFTAFELHICKHYQIL